MVTAKGPKRKASSGERLSNRALNRALLQRQLLVEREVVAPLDVIEKLLGLQAQQARPPFVGLWTRVAEFEARDLLVLLHTRRVVRATFWRGTLHMVSAADFLQFRGSVQTALTAGMESILKSLKAEMDVPSVLAEAAQILQGRPQRFEEIRGALSKKFPEAHERAMGYATRTQVPLVMIPEDRDFGFDPDARFGLAKEWLGKAAATEQRLEDLVRRYLAGFGPATVADAQTWSGIPKLKSAFEALRPELRVFESESGTELFDLEDAPRPDESLPVPVRFLPGFDNIVLGHKERSRIVADEYRGRVTTQNLQVLPTFLLDGFVAGTWEFRAAKKVSRLELTPFRKLLKREKDSLEAEGQELGRFLGAEPEKLAVAFLEN